MNSEQLLFLGIILMAVGATGGIAAVLLLRRSGKQLKKRLDQEFGVKRC